MRSLLVLLFCVLVPAAVMADEGPTQGEIEARIAHYAKMYGIPFALLRKVVKTESTFNPAARNGPYWGLMQIRHDTAQGLGYRGPPTGLLDAETNLIYGGAYLANAYIVAGGNERQAHALYKSGYYFEAKRKRMLAKLIKVPMGAEPVMVAGRTIAKPAANEPENAKLVVASLDTADAAPKPIAKPTSPIVAAKPAPTIVEAKAEPEVVAKPVVAKAEIVMPLLPRRRPAAPIQVAALTEPKPEASKPEAPRGLLFATALVPASQTAGAINAGEIIARPELALAGASSGFARDATAAAFAPAPRPAPPHSTAALRTALRLTTTQDKAASDTSAQSPAPAAPLPRHRPVVPAAHKAN
ncbi:hypothetical protein K32_26570 [Kaistia sp. 32K]|nr:hypothetical protein K32_26570 [Kaistia sp. 32K]